MSLALPSFVAAHGGAGGHQKPLQVDADADWATRHMAGNATIPILEAILADIKKRNITLAISILAHSSPCTISTTMDSGTSLRY